MIKGQIKYAVINSIKKNLKSWIWMNKIISTTIISFTFAIVVLFLHFGLTIEEVENETYKKIVF